MRFTVAALVFGLAAREARAEERVLIEAQRHADALEYEEALALVERGLRAGTAGPDEVVDLHVFAGKLAAGLDRAEVATAHFARALALRPSVRLPDGTSPKLRMPFEAASLETAPLVVVPVRDGDVVGLGPGGDRLGMVRGVAVDVADGGVVSAREATRVAVPAGATVERVAALDEFGNRIWEGTLPVGRAVPDGAATVVRRERPALVGWWPTWTVASGAALAVGSVAAWRLDAAQREFDRLIAEPDRHDFSEIVAVEDRGTRWKWTANVAFGVAAATAVTAVVLYVVQRRRGAAAITPGGVAGVF